MLFFPTDLLEFLGRISMILMLFAIACLLIPALRDFFKSSPPPVTCEISVTNQAHDSFEELVNFLLKEMESFPDWKPSFSHEITRLEHRTYPIWLTFSKGDLRLFLGHDKIRFIEILSDSNYLMTREEKGDLNLAAMDLILKHQATFLSDVRQSLPVI